MAGYIGQRSVTLSTTVANAQDVTATDTTPEVTIINNTHEDTDGGREGKVIFKGQQSGGEESTLAEIEANHSGSSDDEKGQLVFKTNDGNDGATPTEAMRINSLGNVGIGTASVDVSTQAGGSGYKALQIESDEGGQLNFDHNDAGTGSTLGQINFQRAGEVVAEIEGVTDGATDNGRLSFRTQPDGGALTERMRIDHDGKVGIAVTDPDATLDISGGTNKLGILRVVQRASGAAAYGLDIGLDPTLGDPTFSRIVNDTVTEAFRIVRASGRLHIGQSLGSNAFADLTAAGNILTQGIGAVFGDNAHVYNVGAFTGTYDLVIFRNGNGIGGSINLNGSTTTYATSSDYRMKENVVPISDGITRLKQLKPSRFNFIADADKKVDGFLAHEAQTVVPEAVTGTKDELEVWKEHEELPDGVSVGDNKLDDDGNTVPKMQGVDQSKLVPLLTAALQEAIAKIETLETKVAALEAE